MPENPIKNIEDKVAQFDMGVMAIRIYQGALTEANSWFEAYIATCAVFIGITNGPKPEDDKEDKDKSDT